MCVFLKFKRIVRITDVIVRPQSQFLLGLNKYGEKIKAVASVDDDNSRGNSQNNNNSNNSNNNRSGNRSNNNNNNKAEERVYEALDEDGVRDAIAPLWRLPYEKQLVKKSRDMTHKFLVKLMKAMKQLFRYVTLVIIG